MWVLAAGRANVETAEDPKEAFFLLKKIGFFEAPRSTRGRSKTDQLVKVVTLVVTLVNFWVNFLVEMMLLRPKMMSSPSHATGSSELCETLFRGILEN